MLNSNSFNLGNIGSSSEAAQLVGSENINEVAGKVISATSWVEYVNQKCGEIIGKMVTLSVTGSDVKFAQFEEKTRATLDALDQDVNRLQQLSKVGEDMISKTKNMIDENLWKDDQVVSSLIGEAETKILAVNNSREM